MLTRSSAAAPYRGLRMLKNKYSLSGKPFYSTMGNWLSNNGAFLGSSESFCDKIVFVPAESCFPPSSVSCAPAEGAAPPASPATNDRAVLAALGSPLRGPWQGPYQDNNVRFAVEKEQWLKSQWGSSRLAQKKSLNFVWFSGRNRPIVG